MMARIVWLCSFLILGVVGWSCGDPIPVSLISCQQDTDCSTQQTCVQNICVSRGLQQEASSVQEHANGEQSQDVDAVDAMESPDSKEDQVSEGMGDAVEQVQEGASEESSLDGGENTEEPESIDTRCVPGVTQPCYPFPSGQPGVGLCKAGQRTCESDGTWGECVGAKGPSSENCDGDNPVDDNCDGVIDENCPCLYNGSSKGVCANGVRDTQGKCQPPEQYSTKDICGDGLDNNCDGVIDDGCQCKAGETRECGIKVGICTIGKQSCVDGTWGECVGAIPPEPNEVCDDGKDNNCNGVIDEGCPCNYLDKSSGVCRDAKRDSQGNCLMPKAYSITEICGDGLDNNCDGIIDEGCPCNYLGLAQGVCKNGQLDSKATCVPPQGYNTLEVCGDGLDNNCDGAVDEGCPCNYLGKTTGVCKQGKLDTQGQCVAPLTYQVQEICGDGLDNNCDGVIDEGCSCNYLGKGQGVCTTAIVDATGKCAAPTTYSATEICTDNLDNNCDGNVNEGCLCTANATEPCGSDVGACKKGIRTCGRDGKWGPCVGGIVPENAEVCGDSVDNNCNGVIDEGCPCFYKNLPSGVCQDGKIDNTGVCQPPATYKATEICGDGLDNNCNGVIDEGCPCHYLNKNAGVCANSKIGSNGQCQAPANYYAYEKCDGVDNNCNGVVDETCACNYLDKATGVCTLAYRDGSGICRPPSTYRITEICNDNLDNNCDGAIDEGCPCTYLNKYAGVCKNATRDSKGVCQAPTGYSATEKCGDGLDNNCNGVVDENCPCNYLDKTQGVCTTAVRNSGGICVMPVDYNTVELCDGKDNNCNGLIDESIPGTNVSCMIPGKLGECAKGTTKCSQNKLTCVAKQAAPLPEICDGKDNDCNGKIDDLTTQCFQNVDGYCRVGTETCLTNGTGSPGCAIAFNSQVLRCTSDTTCYNKCPAGSRYKCLPLGGASTQNGCKVQ